MGFTAVRQAVGSHKGTGIRIIRKSLLVALVVLLIGGCNSTDLLLDSDYNPRVNWGHHQVSEGETLYSIAMRYGWDYRRLAAANDIEPPYEIHPGDVIRFDVEAPESHSATRSGSDSASQRTSSPARSASTANEPTESTGADENAYRGSRSNNALQSTGEAASEIDWAWPHSGPIIAKYSSDGSDVNKGVDIGGDAGDSVRAAADGSVVYAGSGLLGYGNLIIVNHSETFLSAYAHNRKILVDEGQNVGQGETIAEMGDSGADRIMLHFEIRRRGDPVNPMQYLPRR
ncbi:peptidoglycan DD-metalloendopeptidase family protein [Salicola sp. Rm-C-2C1-2]|uniref:peptidoglycan DD-metalloendopeptidase family protein n=1 Tax=Salicola sp. Rm-C-2C1-2 TaxID=3141321 RepID=UPI0032E4BCFA